MISYFAYLKNITVFPHTDTLQAWIDAQGESSFLEFCDKHQLSGVIYPHLATTQISQQALDSFKTHFLYQWDRTLRLWSALRSCLLILGEAGIPVITLKGAYLAHRFYGDIHGRPYSDLDLLVPSHSFKLAHETLVSAGFTPERGLTTQGIFFSTAHHLELSKGDTQVDLHHNLRVNSVIRLDLDSIWTQSQTYEIDGQALTVLSDEYCLLVQLLTVHNDFAIGTLHGRVLLDALLVLNAVYEDVDWAQFIANRRQDHTYTICVNVFAMILNCFDAYSDFPIISDMVKQNESIVVPLHRWEPLLFTPVNHAFWHRKWLAFSMYDIPAPIAFGQWLLLTPLRYIFYRQNLFNRLDKRHVGR